MSKGPFRHAYSSRGTVTRLASNRVLAGGIRAITWEPVADVVDDTLGVAGELKCLVVMGQVTSARSSLPPKKNGRTNDVEADIYFDITSNLRAGDRITMSSGPVSGVWEIRTNPEVDEGMMRGEYMRAVVLRVSAGTLAAESLSVGASHVRHFYSSVVSVIRDGSPITEMVDPLHGVAGQMRCRLVMGYYRPGVDTQTQLDAGRTRDREGMVFFDYTDSVKAGDYLKCVSGPHTGVFELRTVPDVIMDFSKARFLCAPFIEVSGVIL